MKMKTTKNLKITLLTIVMMFFGLMVAAKGYSATIPSYASIENLEKTPNSIYRIIEIVPKDKTGSIGYYIGEQEPFAPTTYTDVAGYNAFVSEMINKGVMANDDSAPLSTVDAFPWEKEQPSGAVSIAIAETTTTVNGEFIADTNTPQNGGFIERPASTPTAYEYVGTGGTHNFTKDESGASHTVFYSEIIKGYTNNNWFKKYVFDEVNSNIKIEVISITPDDDKIDTDNELETLIKSANMIVFSAGFEGQTEPNLADDYKTNDFTDEQLKVIMDSKLLDPNNQDAVAVMFDLGLVGLEIPDPLSTPTNPLPDITLNISKIAEELLVYSGRSSSSPSSVPSSGYIHKNIYAFGAKENDNVLPVDMKHIVTTEFNTPFADTLSGDNKNDTYNDKAVFYPVLDEILLENQARELDNANNAGVAGFVDWEMLLEQVSMANGIRHIVNYTLNDIVIPEIKVYKETGDTTEFSYFVMPTVFEDGSLKGEALNSDQMSNVTLNVNELNAKYFDRKFEVYIYYQDDDGEYYLDKTTNSMNTVTTETDKDALKFSRKEETAALNYYDDLKADSTGSPIVGLDIVNKQQQIIFNSDIVDFFDEDDDYKLEVYYEFKTKLGARYYSDLSTEIVLQKLGLLMLG